MCCECLHETKIEQRPKTVDASKGMTHRPRMTHVPPRTTDVQGTKAHNGHRIMAKTFEVLLTSPSSAALASSSSSFSFRLPADGMVTIDVSQSSPLAAACSEPSWSPAPLCSTCIPHLFSPLAVNNPRCSDVSTGLIGIECLAVLRLMSLRAPAPALLLTSTTPWPPVSSLMSTFLVSWPS